MLKPYGKYTYCCTLNQSEYAEWGKKPTTWDAEWGKKPTTWESNTYDFVCPYSPCTYGLNEKVQNFW